MIPKRETKQYSMWINGLWVEAQNGKRFTRESPSEGVIVSEYPQADKADTAAAVAAARQAFDAGPWPHMPGVERARLLNRVADAIRKERDEVAEIDVPAVTKPMSQAREQVDV